MSTRKNISAFRRFYFLSGDEQSTCVLCVRESKTAALCEFMSIARWGREYLDFFEIVEEKSLVTRDRSTEGVKLKKLKVSYLEFF